MILDINPINKYFILMMYIYIQLLNIDSTEETICHNSQPNHQSQPSVQSQPNSFLEKTEITTLKKASMLHRFNYIINGSSRDSKKSDTNDMTSYCNSKENSKILAFSASSKGIKYFTFLK